MPELWMDYLDSPVREIREYHMNAGHCPFESVSSQRVLERLTCASDYRNAGYARYAETVPATFSKRLTECR